MQDALREGLLGALIDVGCEQLRVIVMGTSYVELALNRLVLTQPRAVIQAQHLAFSLDEVKQLYAGSPAPYALESILEETRGWPIALRLVQLGGVRPDAAKPSEVLLQSYVRDHILGAVPDALAQVILETSLCAELSPELAVAICGRDDAEDLLESCVRMGLFIDRYQSDAGERYRWHGVFARQCRQILADRHDGRREEVLRAAARHLEPHDPLAAATYWVEAGEPEEAVRTVLARWLGLIVGPSASALERWCTALPAPHVDDPRILLIRACVQHVEGQEEVARILAARGAADDPSAYPGYELVSSLAQMLLTDDRSQVAAASGRVRTHLASASLDTHDRAALFYLLGLTELRHRLSPQLVIQMFTAAITEADAVGSHLLARRSRGHLAFALAWAGRLTQATSVLSQTTADAEDGAWQVYMGGGALTASGYIAYWMDDLQLASAELIRAIRAQSATTSFAGIARMMLAFTAAAARDPGQCRLAAREIRAIPTETLQGVSWPAFRHASQAALYEVSGDRARAMRVVEQYEQARDLPLVTAALAGIASRSGQPLLAARMLGRLDRYADVSYIQVQQLFAEAVVHSRRGRLAPARELVERALEVAVRENVRRPIAGGGLDLRQLLTEQLAWGTPHEEFVIASLAPKETTGPLQALSERERAVFAQLHTTRTVQEIADNLHVSINTVKTHQRSIYRKLGVASRREAVRIFG